MQIEPDSVVYCDIPYSKTKKYEESSFDHARFYDWALSRDFPVFVSEYQMPDGFAPIAQKGRRGLMSSLGVDGIKPETLWVQRQYADRYKRDLFL